uniref:Uncharacterized protein n=1 Tax=Anguilla anguilla TaxID=7936 RepID=A0A0E9TCH9_ANGAN
MSVGLSRLSRWPTQPLRYILCCSHALVWR